VLQMSWFARWEGFDLQESGINTKASQEWLQEKINTSLTRTASDPFGDLICLSQMAGKAARQALKGPQAVRDHAMLRIDIGSGNAATRQIRMTSAHRSI
jgi:hypothetical protein